MFDWINDELARLNRQRQQDIRSFYGNAYQPPAERFVPKDYRRTPPADTPAAIPGPCGSSARMPRSRETRKRGNSGPSDTPTRK